MESNLAKYDSAEQAESPVEIARLDPRSRRTREAIMRAAQDLFGRGQPGNVGVEELIRAAGVSKQTFYNHFIDRDELTRKLVEATRAEFDRRVDEAIAQEPDPARQLANLMCVYAGQALLNPARARLIAALPLEDAMLAPDPESRTMRIIRDGIAGGRLASPAIATGAALAVASIRALVSRIIIERDAVLAAVASQQFITLVLRAFGLAPLEAEMIATAAAERIVDQRS